MRRNIILHIGTEKTGSSSVQRFLAANRSGLLNAGYYYPASPGNINHMGLACYCNPETTRDLQRGGAFDRNGFADDFGKEMADIPSNVHTVLMSNEHLHSRVNHPDEIQNIRDLLTPFAERLYIIVYLRRQIDIAVSLYSTALRGGSTSGLEEFLSGESQRTTYYGYDTLLDNWASVFPASSLFPFIYESVTESTNGVLDHFLHFSKISYPHPFPHHNTGLNRSAQQALRHVNRHIRKSGKESDAEGVRHFVDFLEKNYAGRGERPDRKTAMEFQNLFAASNRNLASAWFGGTENPFPDDFSGFPEAGDTEVDTEALLSPFIDYIARPPSPGQG